MNQDFFNWIWIFLLFVMIVTRKYHEKKAGRSASLKGTPVLESILMIFWGLAASVLPIIYIFSEWLIYADYVFDIHWILKLTGVFIFVLSIWLLHQSHIDLGEMWSVNVEPEKNSELIVTGVYKRTRHPMYTAHLLWGIAQLLIFPNYITGPPALLIFLIVIKIRIPREEKALTERFGDDYKKYILQTGRIFPKLIYKK